MKFSWKSMSECEFVAKGALKLKGVAADSGIKK